MIRVGTCSWADESFSKAWYPKGVKGSERLSYYAERFDVVEANSTFYRLPDEELVARWARLLPDGFVMHVKAFGLMTRHPVKLDALPEDLHDAVEADERGRVDRPSREVRGEVFRRFLAALEPLREADRLGGILMQFPPYVVPKPRSYEYLEWAAEQLAGEQMLVEFRHRSWLEDDVRDDVMDFLRHIGATYVMVDAPRSGAANVAPTVVGRTSETAYLRLHGRNQATWNKRGGSAAERFDYLYSTQELAEWVEPLRELAAAAEQVFVMFNNNGSSTDAAGAPFAQAPINAAMMQELIGVHVG